MPSVHLATALFDYAPEAEDELELHVDDVVCVTQVQDDGWCRGYIQGTPATHTGLFPANYIQDAAAAAADVRPRDETTPLRSHLPPYRPAPQAIARRAKALFAYTPQEPDELALHAGDVVVVTESLDDGWCRGYVAADPKHPGVFPSNYVDIQTDSWTTTTQASPVISTSGKHTNDGNGASKSPTQSEAGRRQADDDDDPHWRRQKQVPLAKTSKSSAMRPSNDALTGSASSLAPSEVSVDSCSSSSVVVVDGPAPATGYYDDGGNYMTDGGYYDPLGQWHDANDVAAGAASAAAGYYDDNGYYITSGGYYDPQGQWFADAIPPSSGGAPPLPAYPLIFTPPSIVDNRVSVPSEATPASPVVSPRTGNRSVLQLKQDLKRAKENAERALAARQEAETQMQAERDARRRAERAAADRLQRQLTNETKAKEVEAAIRAQIRQHETKPTTTRLEESVQPPRRAIQIQRWYRDRRQQQRRTAAATRIQHCGRVYLGHTKRRHRQAADGTKQLTRDQAATRIQQRGRRYVARRRLPGTATNIFKATKTETAAGMRLQRWWRRYMGRLWWHRGVAAIIRTRKKGAAVVQSNSRATIETPSPRRDMIASVGQIQKWWRRYVGRMWWHRGVEAIIRTRKKQDCATQNGRMMQQPNGFQTRTRLSRDETAAVRRVQKWWRSYVGRMWWHRGVAAIRKRKKEAAIANANTKKTSRQRAVAPTRTSHEAVRRIQKWWRRYVGRMWWRRGVAAIRTRKKQETACAVSGKKRGDPKKAPSLRPKVDDTMPPRLVPARSVAVLPIYTTDVAQISQLASLIANSVNVELDKRMRVHNLQLDRLATSVLQLQHAIEKHNETLERVFSEEDGRRRRIEPLPSVVESTPNNKPDPTRRSWAQPATTPPKQAAGSEKPDQDAGNPSTSTWGGAYTWAY
ncbi:Aste57867_20452 [Aphanomyces stellatus]|uniref:Aste57867_20452 protein n=1 Tax=Aphanomyces stellatus TaxID=120398 RepID=A0A485LF57_9STRA|nr:hypothetical protein As57867_020386 [Aphanomyces stellatus]VFT97138.1 Aste57867_20452 [Aphanomyces stellatus]